MQKTFSIAYTSVRPDSIISVVRLWLSRSTNPSDVEVIIAIDHENEKCLSAAKSIQEATVVINEGPKNCVSGWNVAAANTTGKVIICVADDFLPPFAWNDLLLQLNPPNWIEGEYVVHVASGYVEDIAVLSIATRKRYERFGYMLYAQYESLFSDTEFTEVAYRDGVVINAKHLLFEHMHCDCGKRPKDEHDVIHGGKDRWNRGEMLFNYRKQMGFPIDDGPKAKNVDNFQKDSPDFKCCAYIQANKDDFCLQEVCQRLIEEGVKDFFFCVPDEYWSGTKTPQADIDQVRSIAQCLEQEGASVRLQVFKVAQYRFPGDSRIAVETRVRNDSLSWMRRSGFQHILIVDGDELWTRGLLEKIKDVVLTSKPTCISVPMIPVVGLPGYPVHGATDRAIAYIDGVTSFRECHSPAVEHFMLNTGIIIHFTACRKTMQGIIDKHRASGHYDDPEYAFEEWIKNVLPNLKPGWKGAHMYRRYQIWPLVRNWTSSEMNQIPVSLHQYLGKAVNEPSPIQPILNPLNKTSMPSTKPKQDQWQQWQQNKVTPFHWTQTEEFTGQQKKFHP